MRFLKAIFRGLGALFGLIGKSVKNLFVGTFDTVRYFRSYPFFLNLTVLFEFLVFGLGVGLWVRGLVSFFVSGGYMDAVNAVKEEGIINGPDAAGLWVRSSGGFYNHVFLWIVAGLLLFSVIFAVLHAVTRKNLPNGRRTILLILLGLFIVIFAATFFMIVVNNHSDFVESALGIRTEEELQRKLSFFYLFGGKPVIMLIVLIVLGLLDLGFLGFLSLGPEFEGNALGLGERCVFGFFSSIVWYFLLLPILLWLVKNIIGMIVLGVFTLITVLVVVFTGHKIVNGSDYTGSGSSSNGAAAPAEIGMSGGGTGNQSRAPAPAKLPEFRPGDRFVLTENWVPFEGNLVTTIRKGTQGRIVKFSSLTGSAVCVFAGQNGEFNMPYKHLQKIAQKV